LSVGTCILSDDLIPEVPQSLLLALLRLLSLLLVNLMTVKLIRPHRM
jgi:hypothetical protein